MAVQKSTGSPQETQSSLSAPPEPKIAVASLMVAQLGTLGARAPVRGQGRLGSPGLSCISVLAPLDLLEEAEGWRNWVPIDGGWGVVR